MRSSSSLSNMLARTPVATSLAQGVRSMSASAKVWINKDTKVICQGFTGKQVCLLMSPIRSSLCTAGLTKSEWMII